MSDALKTFSSKEFVNRSREIESVFDAIKSKSKGVLIFEGDKGSGKTTLLFELYRRLSEDSALSPFLVSLSAYSAPEFTTKPTGCWVEQKDFTRDDVMPLLKAVAKHLDVDFIETDQKDLQKEYLAKSFATRNASASAPVLLVDSIYECSEELRNEIEKYIFSSILSSEKVFLILSGRGKRPVWVRQELQTAEISPLSNLAEDYVKEMLKKIKSPRVSQYKEISRLSGGYPLIARVMGTSNKDLPEALSDAIDMMLADAMPSEKDWETIRAQVEKLSLVNITFRISDVEDYIFPNEKDRHIKTVQVIEKLNDANLMRYEGKGYQLNKSLLFPLRNYILEKQNSEEYQSYIRDLEEVSQHLQTEYPAAKSWYQRMVPEGLKIHKS